MQHLRYTGCVVHGTVTHGVLSTGVVVEAGAVVRDSVVMDDTVIEAGAVVDRCVVDKQVRIGRGARVGAGDDGTPNRDEPELLNTGIALVGKGARVPPSAVIGRNRRIDPYTTPVDYPQLELPGGSTVAS